MKPILIVLLLALFLPSVVGIEDCMTLDPLTQKDIPCMIITSYPYTENCDTFHIKFFNSTPEEIGRKTLNNYTGTDVCNTTFNFTTRGSYTFNISSGESGRIIVESEEDNMASFAVMAFLMALTGSIFWLAMTKQFNENAWTDEIIRRGLYIVGVLLIAMLLAVSLTLSANFGLGLGNELYMLLWITHKGAYIAMLFLVISAVFNAVGNWKIQKQNKRMGVDNNE